VLKTIDTCTPYNAFRNRRISGDANGRLPEGFRHPVFNHGSGIFIASYGSAVAEGKPLRRSTGAYIEQARADPEVRQDSDGELLARLLPVKKRSRCVTL
jgi:hypothetical protein